MFLASTVELGLTDSAVIALLGYAVVFFGLVLLMVVVMLLGKALSKTADNKKPEPQTAPAVAPVAPTPVATQQPATDGEAPGSAGKLKLHDVPPKTAAMLMAIVADKMGKPLNELRFISIKEEK